MQELLSTASSEETVICRKHGYFSWPLSRPPVMLELSYSKRKYIRILKGYISDSCSLGNLKLMLPVAITSVFRNNSLAAKIFSYFLENETKNQLFYFPCWFLPSHLLQHSSAAKLRQEVSETVDTQANSWPATIGWSLSPVLILYSWLSGQGFLPCLSPPGRGAAARSEVAVAARAQPPELQVRYKGTGCTSRSLPADTARLSQEDRDSFHPSDSNSSIFHGVRKTLEDFFLCTSVIFILVPEEKQHMQLNERAREESFVDFLSKIHQGLKSSFMSQIFWSSSYYLKNTKLIFL